MAKVSGQVTLGAVAVEGARILLLKDTGVHLLKVGQTTSDVLGEYSFIHDKAVLVTEEYHVICQYVSGVPEEYRTLSFPYITPVASADANNFVQISGHDLMPHHYDPVGDEFVAGWNLVDYEDLDLGLELSGLNITDMP